LAFGTLPASSIAPPGPAHTAQALAGRASWWLPGTCPLSRPSPRGKKNFREAWRLRQIKPSDSRYRSSARFRFRSRSPVPSRTPGRSPIFPYERHDSESRHPSAARSRLQTNLVSPACDVGGDRSSGRRAAPNRNLAARQACTRSARRNGDSRPRHRTGAASPGGPGRLGQAGSTQTPQPAKSLRHTHPITPVADNRGHLVTTMRPPWRAPNLCADAGAACGAGENPDAYALGKFRASGKE
jgi:hypothetical protein